MKEQRLLESYNNYEQLDHYLKDSGHEKILLVCGSSIKYFNIGQYFDTLETRLGIKIIRFSSFQPNPRYESVVEGVDLLNKEQCGMIIAVGGGSAMDVAKCIKLYSNMDPSENYTEQPIVPNNIDLAVLPTTAGTGSEATRYAVIYYNGEKLSVADHSCIPSVVIVDPSVLNSLPEYQRKATMLDAFCHSIESCWSVNSNNESREYSKAAIEMILTNMEAYLENTAAGNTNMLRASNLAGRAINITQTTAGHALCYKLTSLYGIAHGHAAALCVSKLFPYIADNTDKCIDPRGAGYLHNILEELAGAMGCTSAAEAARKFDRILAKLNLDVPEPGEEDYEILKTSVNPIRLKNTPIELDAETINHLYHQILKTDTGRRSDK